MMMMMMMMIIIIIIIIRNGTEMSLIFLIPDRNSCCSRDIQSYSRFLVRINSFAGFELDTHLTTPLCVISSVKRTNAHAHTHTHINTNTA